MRFTIENNDYKIYFRYNRKSELVRKVVNTTVEMSAVVIRYLTPKTENVLSPSEVVAEYTIAVSEKDFVRASLRPKVLANATAGHQREFRQAVTNAFVGRNRRDKKASA